MVESTMTSKVDRVKSLFDVPDKYLGPRQFDIIRFFFFFSPSVHSYAEQCSCLFLFLMR